MSTYQSVYDAFVEQGLDKKTAGKVAEVVRDVDEKKLPVYADIARIEGKLDGLKTLLVVLTAVIIPLNILILGILWGLAT